jgi:hypothetical protein
MLDSNSSSNSVNKISSKGDSKNIKAVIVIVAAALN